MDYILTKKSQNSKKCKDGKNRNFILYFLNGEQIFKHKRPFDENKEKGFDGRWFYKNTYVLNNTLYQTRYDDKEERNIKYPLSKERLVKFEIPKDLKIELSE